MKQRTKNGTKQILVGNVMWIDANEVAIAAEEKPAFTDESAS